MANFGKIILFRVEDMLPVEESEGAFTAGGTNIGPYYPKFESDGFSKTWPFIKGGQKNNLGETLERTDTLDYRILGKNYRLNGDALESVIYSTLGTADYLDTDLNPQQIVGSGKAVLNYFTSVGKLSSLGGQEDRIKFVLFNQNKLELGLKIATVNLDSIEYENSFFAFDGPAGFTDEFGNNIILSKDYAFANHNMSLDIPLVSNQDSNKLQQYGIGDSIKVKPVYNYYLKKYESFYGDDGSLAQFASNNNFNLYNVEKTIPNFYYLISLLSSPELFATLTENANYKGKTPFTIEGILEAIIPFNNLELTSQTALSPRLTREVIKREQEGWERNSVVVVTPSFYKALSSEINTQKAAHPFYNEIKIPVTRGGTVFRDLLKKAKLYEKLQYQMGLQIKIINLATSRGAILDEYTSRYNLFYTNTDIDDSGQLQTTYKAKPEMDGGMPYIPDAVPRIIEFEAEFRDSAGFEWPNPFDYDFKNSGDFYIDFGNYVSSCYQWKDTPQGEIQDAGLNFNLSSEKRTSDAFNFNLVSSPLTFYAKKTESESNYSDTVIQNKAKQILEYVFNKAKLHASAVFDNLENYSEVLFFEVKKLRTEFPFSVVQTFILPNDPDVGDFVSYIDSQIKYDTDYFYEIYAHTISIGNRLTRSNLKEGEFDISETEDHIIFSYKNDYDIKLIRVPYYNTFPLADSQKKTINIDSPPIPPQVTFFPYKNVNDKIGFWFNVGLGELKMKPVPDYDQDLAGQALLFAALGLNQLDNGDITQKDLDDGRLLFKTDDFGGRIQVYRTTTLPTSYEDFKDKKIADIDVTGPRTLVDDILPNQDYYYMFRHFDVHGLFSNPTPVYHFKMITSNSTKEQGSVRVGVEGLQPILFNEIIYLNQNTYEEQKVEKSFKKYLLLEPTLAQTYLSFNNFETGDIGSVFDTANDIKSNQDDLAIGKGGADFISAKGKKFKIRVTSKQTGRKIDLNVDFKNLSVIENYKE